MKQLKKNGYLENLPRVDTRIWGIWRGASKTAKEN